MNSMGMNRVSQNSRVSQKHNNLWKTPIDGMIKVNFDASVKKAYGSRFEVVFHDQNGKHLSLTTLFITTCFKPLLA